MYILVFIIYMLAIFQFFGKSRKDDKITGNNPPGRSFYCVSAIISFIIFGFGMPAWDFFVGNLDPILYYVGVAGFGLIGIYAMTCVYKSITTCNP